MLFKKIKIFILVLGLVSSLGACSSINDDHSVPTEEIEVVIYDPKPNPEASQISSYHDESLKQQVEKEKNILSEYEKDNYDFENPFVIVDPYDVSPLTALLLFETDQPVSIRLFVGTDKDEELIVNNFTEEKTNHEIPVLGLYPDKNNFITLQAISQSGKIKETTISIKTNPLPNDLMTTKLISSHPNSMNDGLTFVIPNAGKLCAVDSNADIRWYSSIDNRLIFTVLKNGHYLHTSYVEEDEAHSLLMERDFLGKLYHAYNIEIAGYERNNLLHHDVIEMPNSNLLATTHEPNSIYIEDHMHEIDRETGETTQEINVREIMPEKASAEYDGKNASDNDWLHQNAIWPDDDGQSILISGRSQDAILKLSYPQGDIEWILAMDEDWPEEYNDKLLKPIGDVDFPAGQHAVKVLEHSISENQKDIILFDNNEMITRGDREGNSQYSQAIRYRINEEEMTVEQTWDYGKKRGKSFYSSIVGNVQYLYEKDNILLISGALEDEKYNTEYYGKVVEVDALNDDSGEIFEFDVYGETDESPRFFYRAYRYPLYPKNWSYTLSEISN